MEISVSREGIPGAARKKYPEKMPDLPAKAPFIKQYLLPLKSVSGIKLCSLGHARHDRRKGMPITASNTHAYRNRPVGCPAQQGYRTGYVED
jgi:hypothetical protein